MLVCCYEYHHASVEKQYAAAQGLWAPASWAEVSLEVELLGWKQPPAQAPNQKLFETPVAKQRYAFALDLIQQQGARSVLDIGCGEGRLLEYLLTQVTQLPSTELFLRKTRYGNAHVGGEISAAP